jgi:methyl-accepting chemotaxis protein
MKVRIFLLLYHYQMAMQNNGVLIVMNTSLKIRTKIVLIALMAVLAGSGAKLAFDYRQAAGALEADLSERVETIVQVLGDAIAAPIWDYDFERAETRLQRVLGTEGIVALEALDMESEVVAQASVDDAAAFQATLIEIERPIETADGEAVGVVLAYASTAPMEARLKAELAADALGALAVGAAILLGVGLGVTLVTRALSRLTLAMKRAAQGDLDVALDETGRGDEVGEMARALEVFIASARRVEALTAEKRRADELARAEREAMMRTLRSSFGEVVQAAAEGDFRRRAPQDFGDEALNELAADVNQLLDSVETGLGAMMRALEDLAEGDLSADMQGAFVGAFGTAQARFRETTAHLSSLVRAIHETSDDVRAEAAALVARSDELQRRAESQAAALEEAAAAMTEIASAARSNTDGSAEAEALAQVVAERMRRSESASGEAAAAMERITEVSAKITGITGIIDSIALRTGLLSLNSAVEAGRAGKAGAGFAVIAAEVRQLAERTAQAAREIDALIRESAEAVTSGAELVRSTGAETQSIRAEVTGLAGKAAAISSASREQSSGVDEVTQSVTRLDAETQGAATVAEQTTETARALTARAEALSAMVAHFRLADLRAAKTA